MTMPDLAAEAVLIAAGGRAILLQIADPAIGHGVADHSDFTARPLDRLHGTLTFVYGIAFGTPAEAAAVRRHVNHAHGPVRSDGNEHSPAYTAFDPRLQLWVAATLYDSTVTTHERLFGPLSPSMADELYAEYGRLGTALQMPADLWPTDRAAFAAYWNDRIDHLETDDATRGVAHALLHPATGPVLLRAGMPLARWLTAGLLPPGVRDLFGLRWTASDERRLRALFRVLAVVYPRLPGVIRHWPRDQYLRRLRRSLRQGR